MPQQSHENLNRPKPEAVSQREEVLRMAGFFMNQTVPGPVAPETAVLPPNPVVNDYQEPVTPQTPQVPTNSDAGQDRIEEARRLVLAA